MKRIMKEWKKIFQANRKEELAGIAIAISDIYCISKLLCILKFCVNNQVVPSSRIIEITLNATQLGE